MPGLVAVIEMVGARVVEVDGRLDEPQPEHAGVEVDGAGRIARKRCDVVDAVRAHGAGLLFERIAAGSVSGLRSV